MSWKPAAGLNQALHIPLATRVLLEIKAGITTPSLRARAHSAARLSSNRVRFDSLLDLTQPAGNFGPSRFVVFY